MFVFYIHLWNFGKNSIFLASAESFNVKNDNFHSFFFAFLVANVEFAGFAPRLDRFHGNGPYCKILTEKEPMRAQGLGLPYNKALYFPFSGVSGATLRSEIESLRDSVEVGRTLHICSSAIKTWKSPVLFFFLRVVEVMLPFQILRTCLTQEYARVTCDSLLIALWNYAVVNVRSKK